MRTTAGSLATLTATVIAAAALALGAAPAAAQQSTQQVATAQTQKMSRSAHRAAERKEHRAYEAVENEPRNLLKGIKLTKQEKQQVNDVRKRYAAQLKQLKKQDEANEKTATADNEAAELQQIDQLRTQERSDLRAVLTADQQARFDKNAAALDAKHSKP